MTRSLFPVVVTDVDGTLLDHDTYDVAPAVPVVRRLERERIPLVLCSSKTRAEIVDLQARLGIRHPFVTENGGALFLPDGYFPFTVDGARRLDGHEVIEFGRPYRESVFGLRMASKALGVRVTGFHDLSAAEIAALCGLSLEQARRARQRDYDEPFIVHDARPAASDELFDWLRAAGLSCSRGGRFAHVSGTTDKSRPLEVLRKLYQRAEGMRVITIGLGDGPNDVPLLRAVQIPIIVRSRVPGVTELLMREMPNARVSDAEGPDGWSHMVRGVLGPDRQ